MQEIPDLIRRLRAIPRGQLMPDASHKLALCEENLTRLQRSSSARPISPLAVARAKQQVQELLAHHDKLAAARQEQDGPKPLPKR
jgi:hypothetical protein